MSKAKFLGNDMNIFRFRPELKKKADVSTLVIQLASAGYHNGNLA